MKNRFILISFIVLAIIQISASASIIYKYEDTLRNGKAYKFKTAPVDPYDAFRGKYVLLGLETQTIKLPKDYKEYTGQKVFVTLKQDKNGFSSVDKLYPEKPDTDDFITATIQYIRPVGDKNDMNADLYLPIDRYYMEEDIAPKAEEAYRRMNSRSNTGSKNSYIKVRIKSGNPVIEELYLDNLPIREYIDKEIKE